jgi:hypothetical protein
MSPGAWRPETSGMVHETEKRETARLGGEGHRCGWRREPEPAPDRSRSECSQDDGADEGESGARDKQVDVTHKTHG